MKIVKISFFILSLLFFSCKTEKSLEQYFIANEDNDNIVIVDVPISMVNNTLSLTEKEKKAIKSVKKLNLLFLKKEENNKPEFEKQKQILSQILRNKKYQTLSKLKSGKTKIDVKFVGSDDAINEIVLFASDKEKGFLLARILGDKMNPDDMQLLIKNIQNMNFDMNQLNQIDFNL